MERFEADDHQYDCGKGIGKRLALIGQLTRSELDDAGKVIDDKLQAAITSLEHSAAALQMLLAAQSDTERASVEGQTLRKDLEALLASSAHLMHLATLMQGDFHHGRQAHERRTEEKIAEVVSAIASHRAAVQDNAIALTEAALSKARAPLQAPKPGRFDDRRTR